MKRHPALASLGGAILIAAVVEGCMPAAATSQGRAIGDLYRVFVAAGIVVAVIVWGLATWAIVRYRRRDDRLPIQTRGDVRVEAIWTAIPLVTVLVLFGLTLGALSTVEATGTAAVRLQVTAFRWQWQAVYPDESVTIVGQRDVPLEVVLPVDQTVHVELSSLDVNHAFFVPAFLFKRDAIPGKPSSFDLVVEQAGTYSGACAEFCGVLHDQMPFTIRAVSAADYEAWLASARAGGG
jgi:cytochrome c oxidase subunit 2